MARRPENAMTSAEPLIAPTSAIPSSIPPAGLPLSRSIWNRWLGRREAGIELLESQRGGEERPLRAGRTDDLHTHRQALRRPPRGERERGQPGQVHRAGEGGGAAEVHVD